MIEYMQTTPPLIPGEVECLMAINGAHHPILDAFMYMISNPLAWFPLVGVLVYYLFSAKPWQEGVILLLCIGLSIICCDQLSSGFAKPFFARFRPTHMPGVAEHLHIVYNYKGALYGFFSGHASNFFAVALLLSRTIRHRATTIILFLLVSVVAYSRVYQGVHFISDILVGIIVGLSVGYLISLLQAWLRKRFSPLSTGSLKEIFRTHREVWFVSLLAFMPIVLIYAIQFAKILKRL